MITLILASAMVCTNVNNVVVCNPVSQGEARALESNQLVSSFARICMSKIRADKRDQYPGGWIQLVRDCEAYGQLEAKRTQELMRSVDQTSLQR
jgi:hypothetical protein